MTTTPEELLPCPFCGESVELIYIGNDFTPRRRVSVEHIKRKGCPVKFKQSAIKYDHKWLSDKVIEAWNTRVNND
jgi:hypothetical protein